MVEEVARQSTPATGPATTKPTPVPLHSRHRPRHRALRNSTQRHARCPCAKPVLLYSLSPVFLSHIFNLFIVCVGHCRCIWNQTKRKCQPAPPPPAPPPLPGQNGQWNGPVKGTYGDADCPNVGCYGTSSRPYTVQECEKLCNSVQGCNAMNAGSIGCCLRACGPGMQHGPKLNGQCCGFYRQNSTQQPTQPISIASSLTT